MQKIYYDATANKQVVDVSGVKDEAKVKAEFGLGNSTQIVEIDESFEATRVNSGTLEKFDHVAEANAAAAAAQAAKDAKKAAVLDKLNKGKAAANKMTAEDLDDLLSL